MPNWTQNSLTLEGTAEDLQHIYNNEFNFHKLHPCPFINGENYDEGWYEWCCKHWGTKWSPDEPDINYSEGDTSLSAIFQTAWTTPHALFAYLTVQYPSLTITCEWEDENYETVGITTYSHGEMDCQQIDPMDYTKEALEQFAETHDWFSYDDYCDYYDESDNINDDESDASDEEDDEEEGKKDQVIIKYYNVSYVDLIE